MEYINRKQDKAMFGKEKDNDKIGKYKESRLFLLDNMSLYYSI